MSTPGQIPKGVLPALRNIPRDIFDSIEAVDPGALPALYTLMISIAEGGLGLDLSVNNSNLVAGTAILVINNSKIVTLIPGANFGLDNVLFTRLDVLRAGAGAISVNIRLGGVSFELLDVLGGRR